MKEMITDKTESYGLSIGDWLQLITSTYVHEIICIKEK